MRFRAAHEAPVEERTPRTESENENIENENIENENIENENIASRKDRRSDAVNTTVAQMIFPCRETAENFRAFFRPARTGTRRCVALTRNPEVIHRFIPTC